MAARLTKNEPAALNIGANPSLTLSARAVDASAITPTLLQDTLHEVEELAETGQRPARRDANGAPRHFEGSS